MNNKYCGMDQIYNIAKVPLPVREVLNSKQISMKHFIDIDQSKEKRDQFSKLYGIASDKLLIICELAKQQKDRLQSMMSKPQPLLPSGIAQIQGSAFKITQPQMKTGNKRQQMLLGSGQKLQTSTQSNNIGQSIKPKDISVSPSSYSIKIPQQHQVIKVPKKEGPNQFDLGNQQDFSSLKSPPQALKTMTELLSETTITMAESRQVSDGPKPQGMVSPPQIITAQFNEAPQPEEPEQVDQNLSHSLEKEEVMNAIQSPIMAEPTINLQQQELFNNHVMIIKTEELPIQADLNNETLTEQQMSEQEEPETEELPEIKIEEQAPPLEQLQDYLSQVKQENPIFSQNEEGSLSSESESLSSSYSEADIIEQPPVEADDTESEQDLQPEISLLQESLHSVLNEPLIIENLNPSKEDEIISQQYEELDLLDDRDNEMSFCEQQEEEPQPEIIQSEETEPIQLFIQPSEVQMKVGVDMGCQCDPWVPEPIQVQPPKMSMKNKKLQVTEQKIQKTILTEEDSDYQFKLDDLSVISEPTFEKEDKRYLLPKYLPQVRSTQQQTINLPKIAQYQNNASSPVLSQLMDFSLPAVVKTNYQTYSQLQEPIRPILKKRTERGNADLSDDLPSELSYMTQQSRKSVRFDPKIIKKDIRRQHERKQEEISERIVKQKPPQKSCLKRTCLDDQENRFAKNAHDGKNKEVSSVKFHEQEEAYSDEESEEQEEEDQEIEEEGEGAEVEQEEEEEVEEIQNQSRGPAMKEPKNRHIGMQRNYSDEDELIRQQMVEDEDDDDDDEDDNIRKRDQKAMEKIEFKEQLKSFMRNLKK